MDTDDLSTEAYNGIIIESERFDRDLTLRFGLLAVSCTDEEVYFEEALELISALKSLDEENLLDVFFGNPVDFGALNRTLDKIIQNINNVRKIPKEDRHYDF